MGLSRLENFLKAVKGSTIHVNADSLDATDSVENDGSSITRPFKSPQRALIESVRFSYRSGLDNDRFGRSTIIIHPSQYDIDNRPGILVKDDGSLFYRNGQTATLSEWTLPTNFNVYDSNNELYKLNSIHGGVIVPRGVSICAYDLRKTIFRPLYVPNPINFNIERSSILRVTGACLIEGLTFFDANVNSFCYKDYTSNKFTPNFSHHKLSCFEYADGVNDVVVNDSFLNVTTTRSDLEMYYEKIARVYGVASGREIADAIYSTGVSIDLEPVIDEIRIVGSRGKEVGITSIRSGNGITPSTTITVTLEEPINELSVDTPIQVNGIGQVGFDGQFIVNSVNSTTEIQYKTSILPTITLPSTVGSTLNIVVDTVTSASPYPKKCTLRSVYGMCGYFADGSVVEGFKSSVISEFTGVSVQKDDNAFVKYDPISGTYLDSTSIVNLHKDSRARYKPEYEHFHIRLINDAFAELVSTFAIGFAKQYVVESGGDITVNASKSDFGAKAFVSDGFKREAFLKDDTGFISGIIPPKEIENKPFNVEFNSFNVGLTTLVANTSRLYLSNETNLDSLPTFIVDGFRLGAKQNEIISVEISNGTTVGIYTASVLIPNSSTSFEKAFFVQRINSNTENSISNNIITLTSDHNLLTGEKIRIISSDGRLPDGLIPHKIGFAITTGLPTNKLKIAQTFNRSLSNNEIILNKKGGTLTVVSRVSDKIPGDAGHPIQWDGVNQNWYLTVNANNPIYNQLASLGTGILGNFTSRSFVERIADFRSNEDKIFKLQYTIPANSSVTARPPIDAWIIQESNNSSLNLTENPKYFTDSVSTLTTEDELRNPHYISDVKWSSGTATVYTETPHYLSVGSKIQIVNIIPGDYTVSDIVDSNKFTVSVSTNPGNFNVNTLTRNQNLPYFKRIETKNIYQIYKVNEVQEYIYNKQNGIYELIVINNSVSPTVSPFTFYKFSQPLENLYPQLDRDNIDSNPGQAACFALPDKIGEVVVNDERKSITRETFYKFANDFNLGFNVSSITSNSTGLAHTFNTDLSHTFNGVNNVNITNSGSNYLPGTYYGVQLVTSSGIGRNATASITVSGGNVTSVRIMDKGCAYGIGNTATLIPAAGYGTTTGFIPAVVTVSSVVDNNNDTLYVGENNVPFRITGISSHNRIQVASAITSLSNSPAYTLHAGKAVLINSFSYSATTGIATIGFAQPHGVLVKEKIRLGGFDHSYFNQECLINNVDSLTQIKVNLGTKGGGLPTTGTKYIYPTLSSNNGKIIYNYAGITTNLSSQLTSDNLSDILIIPNAITLGLNIGDYLKVDDEVFRIKSSVVSNNVSVFRAQLGTEKQTHFTNSVVRKIRVIPIELHRNSIIRSSSHTFESVGYGPGNYSTSLPEKQDRKLSNKERQLAHSFKVSGGVVYYGANDENGDIYNTNKKIYSSTGKEEVYDAPFTKIVGKSDSYEKFSTTDLVIDGTVKVSGESLSEFDGPLVINNKLTSYSEKGIEAPYFFIQGVERVSRKIGIGTTTPVSGGYGDIIFNSAPKSGNYVGWTYTITNNWRGFGLIQ